MTVAIQERIRYSDGNTFIHTGTTRLKTRYGSNFKLACERALKSAEAEIDDMMATKQDLKLVAEED